ncbi:YceI family protein [Tenacibaculum sp. SG-28]|uniref:YceI family protein n=1 Tax=Tenacibaculum sp. SG-28 TaxID=754426 RepID=UPI000CF38D5B|nr:YceI family protein [Tenacibaculum sp. SG-28]PQJ21544.1 hypothetical protein BSU00_05355 [Tenacibaculum sp. SG-28]
MKHVLLFLLLSQTLFSQKFYTRTGVTEFKASLDAIEPIEATTNSTTVILTNTGEIAAQLFVGSFAFRVALMQEHFNENYMESNEYPKAIFRGKLSNFNSENSATENSQTLDGVLTIKNIEKKVSFPVAVSRKKNTISIEGTFTVKTSDFSIKIPKIVRKKVSEEVTITINYELSEKI